MPLKNNHSRNNSRRDFLIKGSMASAALLLGAKASWSKSILQMSGPGSKFFGVQIGVITYSFRSMPGSIDQILSYVTGAGISAIELMGDAVEDYAGRPVNPVKWPPYVPGQPPKFTDEEKVKMAAYKKDLAAWRAGVPMDKFKEVKKMFSKAGVSIYAFKPDALGAGNTDEEIEYALKAARALGARSVTVELPGDLKQSQRLGDLGAKHKVYIGYHAHTQATDTAWDTALAQSPYNSMNLDCGHYIAAGGNNTKGSLLALIDARHDRITSMHIKDRQNKTNGGTNKPWGEGDTPLKEILLLLKQKQYEIPATIELEYDIPAGSDAVKETKNCLAYAKAALGA